MQLPLKAFQKLTFALLHHSVFFACNVSTDLPLKISALLVAKTANKAMSEKINFMLVRFQVVFPTFNF